KLLNLLDSPGTARDASEIVELLKTGQAEVDIAKRTDVTAQKKEEVVPAKDAKGTPDGLEKLSIARLAIGVASDINDANADLSHQLLSMFASDDATTREAALQMAAKLDADDAGKLLSFGATSDNKVASKFLLGLLDSARPADLTAARTFLHEY